MDIEEDVIYHPIHVLQDPSDKSNPLLSNKGLGIKISETSKSIQYSILSKPTLRLEGAWLKAGVFKNKSKNL